MAFDLEDALLLVSYSIILFYFISNEFLFIDSYGNRATLCYLSGEEGMCNLLFYAEGVSNPQPCNENDITGINTFDYSFPDETRCVV